MPSENNGNTGSPTERMLDYSTTAVIVGACVALGAIAAVVAIVAIGSPITYASRFFLPGLLVVYWIVSNLELRAFMLDDKVWKNGDTKRIASLSGRGRRYLLPIAILIGILPSSKWTVTALTVIMVGLLLSRIWFVYRLRKAIRQLSSTSDDKYGASRRVSGFDSWLLSQRQVGAAVLCVLLVTVVLSGVADGLGWHTGKWAPLPVGTNKAHITPLPPPGRPGQPEDPGRQPEPKTKIEQKEKRTSTSCPHFGLNPLSEGQKSLSEVAVKELNALFSGAHQLGEKETGCPEEEIHEVQTPNGILYWVTGRTPSDPNAKSIAIVPAGKIGESAIVLWPAVEEVEKIIESKEDIGGTEHFPHYYAGSGGDYYMLETEKGTVIEIRETTGTLRKAAPFVCMRPSAAYAWLSLIKEGVWYWPEGTCGDEKKSVITFGLKQTGDSPSRFVIHYYTHKKTAWRNVLGGRPYKFKVKSDAISPGELERFRPPPPPEELQREKEEG